MSKQPPSVAIILINWNQFDDVAECILSLQKLRYSNYKIIVVDNNSTDGSYKKLQEEFTAVDFITRKENEGFTGGMNAGAQAALANKFDYVMLLNSDTVVSSQLLKNLVSLCEQNPKVAIAGPVILDYNDPCEMDFAGGKVNLSTGKVRHLKKLKDVEMPFSSEFMTGCCMLIPMRVVKKYGVFDPAYFAYCEDLDLSLRLRKEGYSLMCDPRAVVWHKISARISKAMRYYFWFRNILLLLKKHANPASKFVAISKILFGNFTKCFIVATLQNNVSDKKALVWGVTDFFKGRFERGRLDELIRLEHSSLKKR